MKLMNVYVKQAFYLVIIPCLAVFAILLIAGVCQSNPSLPVSYRSDGFFGLALIKHVIENGWYYASNARLGAPFGTSFHDFPGPEGIHWLIIKSLSIITGGNAVHVYFYFYYLTFFTVAIAACWSLGRFGLAYPLALSGALLFTFSSYHFGRGPTQLFLSSYFIVPLIVWLAVQLFSKKYLFCSELGRNRFRKSLVVGCTAIGTGICGIYYAFFGVFSIIVAGISGGLFRKSWRPVLNSILIVGLIVSALLINLGPAILYRTVEGPNPVVALRFPQESELYGLKIVQLLFPPVSHKIAGFDRLAKKYNATAPLVNENSCASLSAIGAIGFVALLIVIMFPFLPMAIPKLKFLATLNLAYVLFATVGGFGAIFAYLVSPQIRALNRVSIFILFVSISALLLLIQKALDFVPRVFLRKSLTVILAVVLTVVGLWDQNFSRAAIKNDFLKEGYLSDQSFIRKLETILPAGASVYQMPYYEFPETPPMNKLQDYDLFRGYVHSKKLRWSYGVIKGREAANLFKSIDQMALLDQVKHIKELGFQGIYIDRRGYTDDASDLENGLTKILGTTPLVSENGKLSFYRLSENSANQKGSVPAPLVVLGQGFYNWESSESGKKWAWAGGNAQLMVYNYGHADVLCRLQFVLGTLVKRHVDLVANGVVKKSLDLAPQQTEHVEMRLPPNNGFNALTIKSDIPARPPGNGDPRPLSFCIQGLKLSCEGH